LGASGAIRLIAQERRLAMWKDLLIELLFFIAGFIVVRLVH